MTSLAKAAPAPKATKPAAPVENVSPGMARVIQIRNKCAPHVQDLEAILGELKALADQNRPASELAHLFGVVRDIQDMLSEIVLAPVSECYGKLAKEIVPAAFERENLTSFTTKDGYRVSISTKYFASIAGDKEAAYEWLRNNGLGEIIQNTVNASTLSAAGKAMLEEGKELPDELFRSHFAVNTSLTRTKK
jgi:hypothetical protein